VRWHDLRTHWTEAGLPPAAQAEPDHAHRLRTWSIPLREQARTFEIRGTLDYLPPPAAWLWWVGALLLAAAVTALGLRWPGAVPVLAVIAGTIVLGYAVTRALDAGISAVLFVASMTAVAAGFWRTPFVATVAGALLTVFGGVADAGVFRAAVVPVAGPAWFARLAVLVALGVGLGMVVTGMLRLRKVSEAGAKVQP
jgi:hypothetical protein